MKKIISIVVLAFILTNNIVAQQFVYTETTLKNVVIEEFFPMNLLQKLSLQAESVENWKQLVDSIMIDYNYNGETLEPQIIDIPGKNELVKGTYSIPANNGRIKVKITDLLSESLEVEVK